MYFRFWLLQLLYLFDAHVFGKMVNKFNKQTEKAAHNNERTDPATTLDKDLEV